MEQRGTICVALLCLVVAVNAFPEFIAKIPNGLNVVDPCDSSVVWHGVGHLNPDGGGALNPFGEAFKANGYEWTEELCEADSDGDGISNGAELGDPECEWEDSEDDEDLSSVVTHPGIANNAC